MDFFLQLIQFSPNRGSRMPQKNVSLRPREKKCKLIAHFHDYIHWFCNAKMAIFAMIKFAEQGLRFEGEKKFIGHFFMSNNTKMFMFPSNTLCGKNSEE